MRGEVRVLVHQAARDATELAAVREAYHLVSKRMAGVPGMLGNELLRSPTDPTALVVVSRWADFAAFRAWEEGPEHRDDTAPLRPYRDTRLKVPFGIYEVDAAY
ncbi:antibiotic biosynthesis monooxygenase family protein [Streptomyces iconiensis]|uniref:Antibiotic biosynthesis monooxygenase family protein n=1 Tax=Streptomyces iconiensis TaxID=1384038 RepID=A0ABT6ZY38_9ACTN|nr:antibiotic biosynthesis monooxygenase family protein [Streptomyces iconiensis]MDJ1133971.1 antibiotic biosynthesis monooxygenase family protein [Streptomyces iconiensis]